mmetsp:Transcript_70829/g.132504  ORF Transcript_70829/g.132504 Transcript_70829/m.132504 type:complete len:202 (+) Transcript_70829:1958-2563(+)
MFMIAKPRPERRCTAGSSPTPAYLSFNFKTFTAVSRCSAGELKCSRDAITALPASTTFLLSTPSKAPSPQNTVNCWLKRDHLSTMARPCACRVLCMLRHWLGRTRGCSCSSSSRYLARHHSGCISKPYPLKTLTARLLRGRIKTGAGGGGGTSAEAGVATAELEDAALGAAAAIVSCPAAASSGSWVASGALQRSQNDLSR